MAFNKDQLRWIKRAQFLFKDVPEGIRLYAMDDTLHAAGPIAIELIGDGDPCDGTGRGLQDEDICDDFTPIGRIRSSGGW